MPRASEQLAALTERLNQDRRTIEAARDSAVEMSDRAADTFTATFLHLRALQGTLAKLVVILVTEGK